MVRSRDVVQAEGSARTEGARRATGVRADGAAAGAGSLAPGQRWSASRKRDVVLRLLRGESLEALSREAGVEIYRLDAWRERAMAGLELGLKIGTAIPWRRCSTRRSGTSGSCRWRSSCSASGPGPRSSASLWRCGGRDDERDDLRGDGALFRHPAGVSGLGALALGARRAAGAGTPPGGRGAGAAGAAAEAIGRAAAGGDSDRSRAVPVPRRRPSQGPRPASDPGRDPSRPHAGAARHAGARTALPAPRASGRREDPRREGHHPGAQRDVGTDGVRVFTLDDGWGWIFAAVEHWNAECVGWHVCKVGSRFAALDPIAQGLERLYGSLDADVARGLALRMDHGSQYLSDHFLKQIRYWGIHPSFGFVEEPETNGVAERWNRTLKEQAPRPNLSEPRGRPRRRGRLRGAVQPDLASREAWVSNADRGARGVCATPGGIAQMCVQGTGCGTCLGPVTCLHAYRWDRVEGLIESRIPKQNAQPQL